MSYEIIEYFSLDDGIPTFRQITFINNIPFYRSSGNSSGNADTWFPFFGIQEQDNDKTNRGWLIKPKNDLLPIKLARNINDSFKNKTLSYRFGSLPALLISSALGGGLWESEAGKSLKKLLEERYADFYQSWLEPEFLPLTKGFTKDKLEEVNLWLTKKAEVVVLDDLYTSPAPTLIHSQVFTSWAMKSAVQETPTAPALPSLAS